MNVGMTGTRRGITEWQADAFRNHLIGMRPIIEFHHGDCIGADEQAHAIVTADHPAADIQIHPPTDPKARAFCEGCCWPEKPYLDRNKDIVAAADVMYAFPGRMDEELRSGTWFTIRYARQLGTPLVIIWPDGTTTEPGG